jgi:hypothetical protein
MEKIVTNIYTLENINEILYQGFEYNLPDKILDIISKISLEVGSPDYIKTPVFKKRENPLKIENPLAGIKKKRGKNIEIVNDTDWELLRTFQTTKMEDKINIDSQIDNIRINLNKLSDKNYIDIRNRIIDIIDNLVSESIDCEEMSRVSSIIFDIASTNRFYSKIYADLYSDLSTKYDIMKNTFENNFKWIYRHI